MYLWFANRHHWPPNVVDEQPWWVTEQIRGLAPLWDQAVADAREAWQDAHREPG